MFIVRRLVSFFKALPFRWNPALRFCRSVVIIDPVKFLIDSENTFRGKFSCKKGSLVISRDVDIAKSTDINVGPGGLIAINKGVRIGYCSLLSVAKNQRIQIGDNTTFFSTVFLSGTILIGKGCLFSKNITILSGTHIMKDRRPIREQDAEYMARYGVPPDEAVIIGDDCWIGLNVVVLPGVTLGKGCVVGAGAVVTKDFPDYSKIGGVPAKLLGYRE